MQKNLQFILILLLTLFSSSGLYAQSTDDEAADTDTLEVEIIPIISLNDSELEDDQDEGVVGLLSASKDVFVRFTGFNLSAVRFKLRGYDSENTALYFNNIPANDLESGWAGWSAWSGLNDMTRSQETNTSLESTGYSFGGVGGALNIDSRASIQRKQIRVTYTSTNQGNYNNRIMVSGATGMQENGWAFAAMASRRWAEEAYMPGTFYDGYSYYFGVDRRLGRDNVLSFQLLGAPNTRGKSGASVQEMYDIADNNYYNSYWGFQNGEKRNSRVARRNQPMAVLRWDKKISDKLSFTTAVNYQTGANGSTSLDWYNAPDPRPDYYRKLPSFIEDLDLALEVEAYLAADEANRQLQWDDMYEANRLGSETIENVGGIEGNTVSGQRARYVVLDRRYDADKFNFSSNLTAIANEDLTLSAGLTYQDFRGQNYQLVDDLLGSDYFVDIDEFAIRDFGVGETADLAQNDLNNPNRVVYEGDRYGYDYNSTIQKGAAWGQADFSLGALGVFVAAEASSTTFWRTGNYRNGKFPDSSFGDSEKQNFFNYGLKGGVDYGINGRNYVTANALYQTRAPFFRDAYVSARTRDEIIPNLVNVEILGGEVAYYLRSPDAKAKVAAYYTTFSNQIETKRFYHDLRRTFVNYIMTGVDTKHTGVELAFEAKVPFISGLSVQGAATIGKFQYTSRPSALISQDNDAALLAVDKTVYLKNFYVPGRPQTIGTLGLEYQTANRLTLNVNYNYFDNIWLDFNPDRRTSDGIIDVEPGSEQWNAIIEQEKAPASSTLDVSIRKSFKLKSGNLVNLNLGVRNILNNREFITGGYEQLRYDYETQDLNRFPTRYFYARGINYFLNASWTFK